ncbi:MAG: arsenic transporter [Lentisphaerae bacterium GWF2_57_35]|nr:MAG: arsenic transporter [Lentisphaerae bacterium GWF2_57_35]
MSAWISLAVFVMCYVLFVVFQDRRSWVACGGGLALILLGVLGWQEALLVKVNWNVMGLFFGTLLLAELFMLSRVPAVMAEWLVDRAGTARSAMLFLCGLSGVISMFVENVAVVLLVAPVALSLADKLKMNPVKLLIGIAVSSNLQGTATMIGDPPSMILAGYMRMGFFDFLVYQGRPGIFFAVQIGAVASLLVLAFLFRKHREGIQLIAVEKARSWFPAILLLFLVAGLSVSTVFDPEFAWFAGVFTLVLAAVGAVWYILRARWGSTRGLFGALDWDTTFFLIGVFVLVGGLSDSGWLDKLSGAISALVGSNVLLAFVTIVAIAVAVSGFVDNVPFLLAMIPVVQKVADQIHTPAPLLMYGLLIGACLGGNLTPIGASANVVTLGILRRKGYRVSFAEFMQVGIPFTAAAVAAASIFVWLIWTA